MRTILLSLGKLATGQAGYYLDQAHGSVTRAQSVSSAVEDYYLGGAESAGDWCGAGAAALGSGGTVAAAPLQRVLAGEHPATGAALGRVLAARRPGFDLTFSAPKSVSLLFGIGDDHMRAVLRDAHDRAVQDAFGYLERHAALTRRGPAGVHAIAGQGLVGAAFRHRTSRAGDPQLHTHVLVANLTLGADGRWSTLDARRIYAHAKTAGYLYEARLRALVTRELGFEWSPARNGISEIAGISPQVLRAFSRRRAEIEAELDRRGVSGAAAAEVATLATRRGKDYRVTPEQLVPEWRKRAAAVGLTVDVVQTLRGRVRSTPGDRRVVEEVFDQLAAPDGLTRDRATFTRRDVLQALSERLPASVDLTTHDVERMADEFLASPRAVVLAEGQASGVLRRADGHAIPLAGTERVYSTPELLALERGILEYAVERRGTELGLARESAVERVLYRHGLSGEQAIMVRRLTTDGDGVAVVVGPAGAGKTHALAAACEAWEGSGWRVVGAALARRAARELEEDTGIPSTSVAALLEQLERHPGRTFGRRAVFVLDEAAMIPTRQLARLVEHARERDVKLVLLGDDRQLPAIGPGGVFRALLARLPAIELQENRRQDAQWERDALQELRDGDVRSAVARYRDADRIVVGTRPEELRRALVADWWQAGDPVGAVMMAQRRVDVADLNGRAHALMRASGALGEQEMVVAGIAFAAGDRVLVRRNDPRFGVVNGDRGVVTDVNPQSGRIGVDLCGRQVALPREFLDQRTRHGGPSLMHGYAMTVHLAQGMTCRQTFVLADELFTREAGYVAMSRGRESNRLYVLQAAETERDEYAPSGAGRPDALEALMDTLSRSRAERSASDIADGEPELARVVREREELARASTERSRLERSLPAWFRVAARSRHAEALERAVTAEQRANERVVVAEEHLRQVRARENRAPEVVHLPERRFGRNRELGR